VLSADLRGNLKDLKEDLNKKDLISGDLNVDF
jgi:hypothetical protein